MVSRRPRRSAPPPPPGSAGSGIPAQQLPPPSGSAVPPPPGFPATPVPGPQVSPRSGPVPPPPGFPATPTPPPTPQSAPPPGLSFPPVPSPTPGPIQGGPPDTGLPGRRPVSESADIPDERTVLATRRRQPASLVLPDGAVIPLQTDEVVIGRRVVPDHYGPDVQIIIVKDVTKTVSKTHAKLTRTGNDWVIEDLGSTNGIYLVTPEGAELEVKGQQAVAGRILLGDAEFNLRIGA